MKNIVSRSLVMSSLVGFLTACGGGSGSDTGSLTPPPAPAPTSTTFSLGVSDAPVDDALAVVVYFDEVELIGNADPIRFTVSDGNGGPRMVDLLTVQGSNFASLVSNEEIPLGEYTQLRLSVTDASYIEMEQGTFPLKVPSGELKLDGFTALANVTAAYTVEFVLRKSLVDPKGQPSIFLKPRGVRLVANAEVGVLEGTVAESLVLDPSCSEKADPLEGNAIYLFEGTGLGFTNLGDDADAPVDPNEISPFSVAEVKYNEDSASYQYQMGYVPQGSYTLAFTCHAAVDEPETDEGTEQGFAFLTAKEANVSAQQTTVVDFP
ncbi:DUF4382 domain-containing protein [Aliiglaciecola sp. CAU 1673]|uniref:DUF4382 domain-containing protein n=1 Tax=Aliiglaciecola sp. CAU 1673 TaxID=3032595 RepID=UPI0023DC7AB3|nr:DUF4382 domain-containing protein [Aliiglaciecola sp. CAU 1673]MDF2176722.1 DUF4382 domain-containing protein [Aliiglaciecola sp. CAU 1673]